MSKELFMAAHEELIEELMAEFPEITWDMAYARTADLAYDRMRDKLADMSDALRLRGKEQIR